MKLALLNTPILTANGVYRMEEVTLNQARELISSNIQNLDSAIGHESTAQVMSALLGTEIPVHRQMFEQQPGQQALVFKLNGRPPEGKVLSVEEIEAIGYTFKLLYRVDYNQITVADERDLGHTVALLD